MAATTQGIDTPRRIAHRRGLPVAAGVKCNAGAIAVVNASGYVQPGTTAAGLIAVGVFSDTVDNSDGANGALFADVFNYEAFAFADGADATPIDRTDIGETAYITDDRTVTITTTGRSAAGRIHDVDAAGVWVVFTK